MTGRRLLFTQLNENCCYYRASDTVTHCVCLTAQGKSDKRHQAAPLHNNAAHYALLFMPAKPLFFYRMISSLYRM